MARLSRLILVFAVALLVLLGVVWATTAYRMINRTPEQSSSGSAEIGGPFTLVDSRGKTVTDRSYLGKWLLVYFGYTHCPDVCPTVLNNIGVALRALGPEAEKVQPLFITVDPKRDTPAVMAEYLKSFDPRIVGLTGAHTQIGAVAGEYRIYFSSHQTAAQKDYLVDHNAYTYVMNPKGKFVDVLGPDLSGEAMAARLQPLLKQGV